MTISTIASYQQRDPAGAEQARIDVLIDLRGVSHATSLWCGTGAVPALPLPGVSRGGRGMDAEGPRGCPLRTWPPRQRIHRHGRGRDGGGALAVAAGQPLGRRSGNDAGRRPWLAPQGCPPRQRPPRPRSSLSWTKPREGSGYATADEPGMSTGTAPRRTGGRAGGAADGDGGRRPATVGEAPKSSCDQTKILILDENIVTVMATPPQHFRVAAVRGGSRAVGGRGPGRGGRRRQRGRGISAPPP